MSLTGNAGTSEDAEGRTHMPGWAALVSVTLVYAVVLLYVVSPFLFGSQSLYIADYTYNFAPAAKFIEQVFSAEHGFTLFAPLWNPYVLGGVPEVAVAWPLSYLPGYVACLFDAPRAQGFLLFFHLLVAGVGGFLWFGQYSNSISQRGKGFSFLLETLTGPPALFGFMFMLCGYMLGSSINVSLLLSACWTPLALYLIDRIAAAGKLAIAMTALFSLVLAHQFGAGRPEMFIAECVIYGAYSILKIAELAPDQSRANAATRFILQLFAALLMSLACNAANIFPIVEAVKSSPQLPKFDPSDALNWSAGWFDYLGLLFMQPLGELNMAHYSLYPTYPNSMAYVTSLFLGAPVMVLAFIGTGDTRWNQKAFWLWIMILFVAVSLGEFVPMWKPIYEAIPSINLLRFPVKMTVFVELALVALAARGWYLANRGEVTGKDIVGATIFWGLIFALGMLVLSSTIMGNQQALGVVMSMSSACDDLNIAREAALKLTANITVAGFMGLATCLAVANLKGQWQLPLRFFVVLAIVASLVINGRMHLWHTVDKTFFDDRSSVLSLVEDKNPQSNNSKSPKEAYWNPLSPPRDYKILSLFRHPIAVPQKVLESPEGQMDKEFMRYARYILAPNTNMDRGINMLSGMAVLPDWQTVFMETGLLPRSNIRADLNHEAGKSDIPLYKWCQATATKYILCPIGTQSEEDLLVRDSKFLDRHYFKVRAEDKALNMRIYEVSPIRKRVQLFASAKKMETRKDALKQINRSDKLDFDPLSSCILTEPGLPSSVSFQSKSPDINQPLLEKVLAGKNVNRPGTAEITADDRESVLVEVDAAVPSVLVFADSYYSGWKATDNGTPTHLFLADGLMKAVLLEPGQHKVAFKYVPRAYLVGLMVSFYTFCVLLALVILPSLWGSLNRMRKRAIMQS